MSFFIELIFPLLIEVALVKWKWLTVTGAVAAGILAFVVLILAKWSIWPLVFFLILGTLAGKIQRKNRAKNAAFLDSDEGLEGMVPVEKAPESVEADLGEGGDIKQGKARDHWQVLANGGIFMLLAFLIISCNDLSISRGPQVTIMLLLKSFIFNETYAVGKPRSPKEPSSVKIL